MQAAVFELFGATERSLDGERSFVRKSVLVAGRARCRPADSIERGHVGPEIEVAGKTEI